MTTDPAVVAELRSLFKSGATPSRLVLHVVARHPAEPQIDRVVRAYFREAFLVPMFRGSASLHSLPPAELPYAGLNARTIHQMAERRAEWDQEPGEPTWLGPLAPQPAAAGVPREFAAAWDTLDESTRDGILRLIRSSDRLYEEVVLLSRLAERLQQQVVALEGRGAETALPAATPRQGAA